jgi:4-amino-4-deoxy-L-arabinose transferase-like glycosyltransferase
MGRSGLFWLTLLAVALPRLAAFAALGGRLPLPGRDQEIYIRLAGRIMEGEGLSYSREIGFLKAMDSSGDRLSLAWASDPGYIFGLTPVEQSTATVEPGYPVLLALFFSVFGTTAGAVFLLNLAAQAAGGIAMLLLGRRLGGERAGVMAMLLYAFYPFFVFYSAVAMTEAFHIAAVPVIVLLTLDAGRGRRSGFWPGVACGILFLVRSTGLFLLPVQLFHLAGSRRIRASLLTLLGFAVCAAPWMIRNQISMGGPSLLPTKGSLNLWMRNNPEVLAIEGIDVPPSILRDVRRTDLLDYPDFPPESDELERSRVLGERAFSFITANPVLFAWLSWERLLDFVSPVPEGGGAGTAAGIVFYVPVLLLSAWCLARRRGGSEAWLPAAVFILYALLHAAGHGGLRYRLPVDTMLIVLAATAVSGGRVGSE